MVALFDYNGIISFVFLQHACLVSGITDSYCASIGRTENECSALLNVNKDLWQVSKASGRNTHV